MTTRRSHPSPGPAQPQRRRTLAALSAFTATLATGLTAPGPAAAGTPGVDEPPPPLPPRPVELPPLAEQRLANGFGVVVAPQPGLPLVSAMLLVRSGPEHDAPEIGRAHV